MNNAEELARLMEHRRIVDSDMVLAAGEVARLESYYSLAERVTSQGIDLKRELQILKDHAGWLEREVAGLHTDREHLARCINDYQEIKALEENPAHEPNFLVPVLEIDNLDALEDVIKKSKLVLAKVKEEAELAHFRRLTTCDGMTEADAYQFLECMRNNRFLVIEVELDAYKPLDMHKSKLGF